MAKPKVGFKPAQALKRGSKPNPFELKKTKSKFSTIGRKTKGEKQNVIKARQEANTKVSKGSWAADSGSQLCRKREPSSKSDGRVGLPGLTILSERFRAVPTACMASPHLAALHAHLPNHAAIALQRKKSLLVEYKQLRKSNTFIDRRFGEEDDRLTEEEKAIQRLTVQRVKETRQRKLKAMGGAKAAKFALGGGDEGEGEELTHLGRSLAAEEDLTAVRWQQRSD